MSIAVGLIGKDGIVLATDSRMVSITPNGEVMTRDDHCVKLWDIKNKIAIADASNVAGWEAEIIERFMKQLKGIDYDQLSDEFTNCVRAEYEKAINSCVCEVTDPKDRATISSALSKNLMEFVLVGYQSDIPKMKRLTFTNGMVTLKHTMYPVYATGAWDIARYLIPKFRDLVPLMNLTELKRFAAFLILESGDYLSSIGGDIQMVVIQQDKGITPIVGDELKQLNDDVKRDTKVGMNLLVDKLKG